MQPSNYPRPVVNEIRFSVIGEAWEIIKANMAAFIVASLISLAAMIMVSYIGSFAAGGAMDLANPPQDISTLLAQNLRSQVISIPFTLLGYALAGPFLASMVHMAFKALAGQKVEVADATWGVNRFVPFALASLLVFTITTIGTYMCCVPGLIAGGLTMLVFPAMVVQGLAPFDALSFSFGRMSKFLVMASLLFLVLYLVSGLGVVACCVGVLVTFPFLSVGSALVYRDLVGMDPAGGSVPVSAPTAAPPSAEAPADGDSHDPEKPEGS